MVAKAILFLYLILTKNHLHHKRTEQKQNNSRPLNFWLHQDLQVNKSLHFLMSPAPACQ